MTEHAKAHASKAPYITLSLCLGHGVVVSLLGLNSNYLSSNPVEVYSFFPLKCLKKYLGFVSSNFLDKNFKVLQEGDANVCLLLFNVIVSL